MKESKTDPKTKQSVQNFRKALDSLLQAVNKKDLNDLEMAGAIQNFEFSYELAWKTLQKKAASAGRRVASPREAFQFAFESGLISNEKTWLDMIESRNQTVHTYDRTSAEKVFKEVKANYYVELESLYGKLS